MSDNSEHMPKYFNDDKTKVICQYCLAEMKMITNSHVKFHDMTMKEYKEKFPDAPLSIRKFRNKIENKSIEPSDRDISISDKTIVKLIKSEFPVNIILKNKEVVAPEIIKEDNDQQILTKDKVFKAVQSVYPNIKRNHIFKKTNVVGNIMYTVMTDFGDPTHRVMIDFSGMAWHMKTPLLTKYRKKDLLSESKWKYVHIEDDILTANKIIEILKSK